MTTCNNIILSQPQSGATLTHEIPDDVSARLNFGPDDISGLRLGDNGELIISFAEGGQLNITNFDSVVDNGNLLYLEDGTLIDPSILTGALRSPQDLNSVETAAGDAAATTGQLDTGAITFSKPQANQVNEVTVEQGQKYVCDFDPTNANVEMRDGKMFLTFADGSQIVINNYDQAELPAALIPEQEILTKVEPIEEILKIEETVEVAEVRPEPIVTTQESVAEQVATIEPAAGEVNDVAQTLAQIAPAAGEGSSGNSGYGFNSAPEAVSFAAPGAIGAIGATALQYNAPNFTPERAPILNDNPVAFSSQVNLDETNFDNGLLVAEGQVGINFGSDGAGSVRPNGSFQASCEIAGNNLSSNGVDVEVQATSNGYIGTADGETVFTFVLDAATGEYVYTQLLPFDHADANDKNEEICLDFGIVVTDADGDRAVTTARVIVSDDAPVIGNDERTIDETNLDDGPITITDSVSVDFGQDGRGSVTPNGDFSSTGSRANNALTSNGVAVVVTETADGYIGKAGDVTVFSLSIDPLTGEYSFTQYENLDHADGNDDNDVISLNFSVDITDFDGDSDTGVITINIVDDAPEAFDDSLVTEEGQTVTGNVQNNDEAGQDSLSTVTQVTINGNTFDVPATGTVDVAGQYGVLTIAADGSYSYVANENDSDGVDIFKYTLRDGDGDTDTAELKITVEEDENPININGVGQTDDSDLVGDDMGVVATLVLRATVRIMRYPQVVWP